MPLPPSCLAPFWLPKSGCWHRASRWVLQRIGHEAALGHAVRSVHVHAAASKPWNASFLYHPAPSLCKRHPCVHACPLCMLFSRLGSPAALQAVVSAATSKSSSSSKEDAPLVQADKPGAAAAPASAAAPAPPAGSGGKASSAASTAAASGADAYERMLASLAAEVAAPGVAADARFDGVRALLAAAPAAGPARANFARSLVGA